APPPAIRTHSSALFFMLPHPPSSTLFPYTTLFRSRSAFNTPAEHENRLGRRHGHDVVIGFALFHLCLQLLQCLGHSQHSLKGVRSEEHTSELQSLTNLVCRLLLEKKNKQRRRQPYE